MHNWLFLSIELSFYVSVWWIYNYLSAFVVNLFKSDHGYKMIEKPDLGVDFEINRNLLINYVQYDLIRDLLLINLF